MNIHYSTVNSFGKALSQCGMPIKSTSRKRPHGDLLQLYDMASLIEHMCAENRHTEAKVRDIQEGRTQLTNGNHYSRARVISHPLAGECHSQLNIPSLWEHLTSYLTDKQRKWVHGHPLQRHSQAGKHID